MNVMSTSSKDKLSRAAWNLLESAKDSVTTIVAQAVQEGKLKLDPAQSTTLQNLIKSSIEAGYHRAYNSYMKEVDAAIETALNFESAKKKQ